MRIPVKSERDAFLLAYGTAAVLGAAVALGVLAGALYGVVLFAGVVIGAFVWELRTRDDRPQPAREAAEDGPSRDAARHRVLVIANETVAGRELHEVIVSTHPQARSRWLESGLVERLREELDIPVHHVVVDLMRVREPAP